VKAAVCRAYGPPEVVKIVELDKPSPNDDEVLIQVRATTVSSGDWRARTLIMPRGFNFMGRLVFGVFGPRQPILGTELAGVVEATGKAVTRFKPGDEVFAYSGAFMGCHVEYKCMAENDAIAFKPASLGFDEAATLSFGGTTALAFLRRARIQRGEKVLVNGATGAVGCAVVQLAKHFGAEVTAVCGGGSFELVRSLGADALIDYTREDFTQNRQTYDIIVDTVGTAPFARSRTSLKDGGRLLVVLGDLAGLVSAPWLSLTTRKKVIAGPATGDAEALRFLAQLADAGELKPVIDRRFPFEQVVDAHRLVDSGRKKGSVVLLCG
jgi:NADPH:quinone reductase-like Zn-dependent oxidoreductase